MVKRTSLLTVSLVIGIVLLALGSSSVLLAHVETGIEIVDSAGDVGKASCLTIDSNDNLHVGFHVSDSSNVLKYATYHQRDWIVETVDSDEISSRMISLCLDSSDNPHVLYQAGYELRYANKTGETWETETISYGSYYSLSLALDTNDKPHISFSTSPETTGYVYYVHKEGDDWIFETIESFDGIIGAPTVSLSVDSVGIPHVVYTGYNGQFTDLIKYAYKKGNSWVTETIDSESYIGLRGISMALDSKDQPHLSYSSGDIGLRYAFKSTNKWTIEDVGLLGRYCSLALDSSDTPHISGLDSRGDLKYAHKREGRWNIQTLDSTGYFAILAAILLWLLILTETLI